MATPMFQNLVGAGQPAQALQQVPGQGPSPSGEAGPGLFQSLQGQFTQPNVLQQGTKVADAGSNPAMDAFQASMRAGGGSRAKSTATPVDNNRPTNTSSIYNALFGNSQDKAQAK